MHHVSRNYKGDGLHPIDRLRAWWQETAELFRSLSPSTFVWVCIDSNASLASQATQYFGLHDAGKIGPQTECFETFLHELELYAPSTFAHFHVGPSTTWSHPSGALHRIDYVLTNHAAFQLTKRTSTMTTYDGSFTHEDHIPVILEAQGWTTLDEAPIAFVGTKMLCSTLTLAIGSSKRSRPYHFPRGRSTQVNTVPSMSGNSWH